MNARRSPARSAIAAAAIDVAAIVVFVALGRDSHDEGLDVTGVLGVAAPFLLALALAWVAARAWHRPTAPRTGTVVWLVTVAAGMVLRHFVFDRGTAAAFVVVATIFLALFLVGWRAIVARVRRSRRRAATRLRSPSAL